MADASTPSAIEAVDDRGRGLRVVFARQADRYTHWIELLSGGDCRRCLTAVEGTSDQPWPASPPWQQLSIEAHTPDRPVALLLGMAGRSLWSASITPDASPAGFSFDVACRVLGPPECMGCRYRCEYPVAEIGAAARSGEVRTSVAVGTQGLEFAVQPLAAQPVPRLVLAEDGLAVVLENLSLRHFPATIRWQYRLRLRAEAEK